MKAPEDANNPRKSSKPKEERRMGMGVLTCLRNEYALLALGEFRTKLEELASRWCRIF